MKLLQIKISNILSFKYFEDILISPAITFNKQLNDDDVHIIIGPNGAGKSNFLEILNQLFKKIFLKQCKFNEELIHKENGKKNTLKIQMKVPENLFPNYFSDNMSQCIEVIIGFNENDKENMKFIFDNMSTFNNYLNDYSNSNQSLIHFINDTNLKNGIENLNSITLTLKRVGVNNNFSINYNNDNIVNGFIAIYLELFEAFQGCIILHNIFQKRQAWNPLKNTFTLISCYRNYDKITDKYIANEPFDSSKLNKIIEIHKSDNTLRSNNEEPTIFQIVFHKLAYEGRNLLYKHQAKYGMNVLKKNNTFQNINLLIKKYLNIELDVKNPEKHNWEFNFNLFKNGNVIEIQTLSSGEKGLLHLIFALYGYDIENGFIIIDEPELHLHPQLQKSYLEIINQESNNRGIQFIIATHSPVFIDEKSIRNTMRFYYDENEKTTKTITATITEEERFLVSSLNYTNSSKIFFVERVIMVEGIADEIFFNYYIKYRKNLAGKSHYNSYELLSLNGKGTHNKWREFLEKWKIKVFFIGDWDNIINMGIVDNSWIPQIQTSRGQTPKLPYVDIIEQFKLSEPLELQRLNRRINYRRKYRDYILKYGTLESYLNIKKSVANVINYCYNFNDNKLSHSQEINGLLDHIFS